MILWSLYAVSDIPFLIMRSYQNNTLCSIATIFAVASIGGPQGLLCSTNIFSTSQNKTVGCFMDKEVEAKFIKYYSLFIQHFLSKGFALCVILRFDCSPHFQFFSLDTCLLFCTMSFRDHREKRNCQLFRGETFEKGG